MAQDLTIPGSTFPATVPSIVTSDLVRGSVQGSDPNAGDANKQGVALGNRTGYLKASVDIHEQPEFLSGEVLEFYDANGSTPHDFKISKAVYYGEGSPWVADFQDYVLNIMTIMGTNPAFKLAEWNFKKPLRYNTFNYKFAAKSTNYAGSSPKEIAQAEVVLAIVKWDNGANLEVDRVDGLRIAAATIGDGNTFRTGTFDLTAVAAGTPLLAVLFASFPGVGTGGTETYDFLFKGGKTRFFFTA